MNCPVCTRALAPTLSICPSCGAMMNDSVREELEVKVTSGRLRATTPAAAEVKPVAMKFVEEPMAPAAPKMEFKKEPVVRESAVPVSAPPPVRRRDTADLAPPKTSPTLVEFQTQKSSVPDWRLQIQNAVQQRVGTTAKPISTPAQAAAVTRPQAVVTPAPAVNIPEGSDPRVAAAMKRVSDSRQAFLPKHTAKPVMRPVPPMEARPLSAAQPRAFAPVTKEPTFVAPRQMPVPAQPRAAVRQAATAVASAPAFKVDTNKLPKIETVIAEKVSNPLPSIRVVDKPAIPRVEALSEIEDIAPKSTPGTIAHIRIKSEHLEIDSTEVEEEIYTDEIEDLASLSMRFGAGLFDLIIGGFASMLLLSPIAFSGGNWMTPTGALTFVGVCAIVMFLYLTASIGFYGKTLGMRLFSLEIVDAVENEYPTLQQAAVNAALYLILLPFAGAGFATCFFNEENRAVHDLLSGTILVREF
jgi:uncharacterized RDD family membrane protein YckC